MEQLHQDEAFTCPIMGADDNYHFELRCEDCDVKRLSRKTLGEVMDLFGEGRVTLDQYSAYRWIFAHLSPYDMNRHLANQPYVTDPDVQRIARKLLRIRDFKIDRWPDVLRKGISDEDQS